MPRNPPSSTTAEVSCMYVVITELGALSLTPTGCRHTAAVVTALPGDFLHSSSLSLTASKQQHCGNNNVRRRHPGQKPVFHKAILRPGGWWSLPQYIAGFLPSPCPFTQPYSQQQQHPRPPRAGPRPTCCLCIDPTF